MSFVKVCQIDSTVNGNHEYTQTWMVISDTFVDAKAVLTAVGLPSQGDTYLGADGTSTDLFAFAGFPVVSYSEVQNSQLIFEVTIDFEPATTGGGEVDDPPWDDDAAYSSGAAVSRTEIFKEPVAGGKPYINTANDQIRGIFQDIPLPVYGTTKNILSFDNGEIALIGSVNSTSFSYRGDTVNAGKALLIDVAEQTAIHVSPNGTETTYSVVNYKFKVKDDEDGFIGCILDQGWRSVDGTKFTDTNGDLSNIETLMNGKGNRLYKKGTTTSNVPLLAGTSPNGIPICDPQSTSSGVYLQYKIYPETNWGNSIDWT